MEPHHILQLNEIATRKRRDLAPVEETRSRIDGTFRPRRHQGAS
jgi:hypothetical protein